ncbi:MAG: uroporphyrinogen-III synthase, partial [Myxococcota bacterium]
KHVVRLKGGDPYLFGRGSEEAEWLAENGVAFEVVPGVPSPLAATAYAGISLTHRALASSVAYLTATESPEKDRSSHDWPRLATATETLVIFMGMRKLRSLMALLIEHGRPPNTPAAVIHAASLPSQKTVVGTVATIADRAEGLGLPSLIVVGEVVRLREKLRWFDGLPLFGKSVLVPRPAHQGGALARLVRERGGKAVCVPAIEVCPPADEEALRSAVGAAGDFDWIVLTSQNAVDAFFDQLRATKRDARSLGKARIAAVGKKTAAALERLHLRPDLVSKTANAEALVTALEPELAPASRVLFPRARAGRDVLPDALRAQGHDVHLVEAYETRAVQGDGAAALAEALNQVDAVGLTSSSIVRSLHAAAPDALRRCRLVSIGPVTTKTAVELGLEVQAEAPAASIESLLDTLEAIFAREPTGL